MRFDVVLTNPPFQDTTRRGKTPHKLWIDFTDTVFDRLLTDGGLLCQVSPASFQSPSNRVLGLMKRHRTAWIDLDVSGHFPGVGSTFATYLIAKEPNAGALTSFILPDGSEVALALDECVFYLPADGPAGLPIHRKVVFEPVAKLAVEWDYVTAHNIRLHDADGTLSRTRTERHVHELLHTNAQRWWSSIEQEFAAWPKVMWSRSGYTRPFFDDGHLGGTDTAYFVRVETPDEGRALAHNLDLELMRYILATARWSGFGNEKVFAALPDLPRDREMTDDELYAHFSITDDEVSHVRDTLGARRREG